jgi:hypothetical protein
MGVTNLRLIVRIKEEYVLIPFADVESLEVTRRPPFAAAWGLVIAMHSGLVVSYAAGPHYIKLLDTMRALMKAAGDGRRAGGPPLAELEHAAELRDRGVLTDDEFLREKARILDRAAG